MSLFYIGYDVQYDTLRSLDHLYKRLRRTLANLDRGRRVSNQPVSLFDSTGVDRVLLALYSNLVFTRSPPLSHSMGWGTEAGIVAVPCTSRPRLTTLSLPSEGAADLGGAIRIRCRDSHTGRRRSSLWSWQPRTEESRREWFAGSGCRFSPTSYRYRWSKMESNSVC